MGKGKFRKIAFYSLIIFFGLALTIIFYLVLCAQSGSEPWTRKIFHILRPLVIGGVIAYIMKSTCNFFERIYSRALLKGGRRSAERARKISERLSLVTTYVVWTSAITLLVVIAARPLLESVKSLASSLFVNLPIYAQKAIDFVHSRLSGQPYAQELFESAINSVSDSFNSWLQNDLANMLEEWGAMLISGVVDIIILIKDLLIGLVISVLLLSNRRVIAEKCKLLVRGFFKENASNAILDECRYADRMFSGFLEGKVIDSTLIGILYYVALLIMQIPYAPLIAVICGVTNIIPIFGPFIGAVPSALIILTEEPIKVLWFIAFVCIMQFIDGYIIDPHIVGGNIKISVFSVLFAVILFGGLWGFFGLLVGVPVFAVIYDIIKKIVYHIFKKKNKEYLIDEYRAKIPGKEERVRASGASSSEKGSDITDNAEVLDIKEKTYSSDTKTDETK